MKILVTGANGYIGTGIVKRLLDCNQDVIATDFVVSDIDKRAKIVAGDIFNLDNPYDFFENPDVVLHLAWRNGFIHNAPSHLADLEKHYNFLASLINSGISKVVVLGSMHEVGFWEGRITQDTPCNPQSLYGIAKNALRESIELLTKQKKTKFQWIRGYYIVGNTEKGSSIFSKITKAEKEGQKDFPFTTGKNQYDFIDYDDFCYQVSNVVLNNDILGIINCCSGVPLSLSSRVEQFIKDNGYNIKLQYGAFPDRPYDSLAVWGDNSKIMTIIEENKRGNCYKF